MFGKKDEWKYIDDADFKILNQLVAHDEHYIKPLYNQACEMYNVGFNTAIRGVIRGMWIGAGICLVASLYDDYRDGKKKKTEKN